MEAEPDEEPEHRTETTDRAEEDMRKADQANGERPPDDVANDTEVRYGENESPA